MKQTHPIQNSPFDFINTDFCIIFQSVSGSSTVSKMSRIYAARSGVQILAGAIELCIFQNIQTIPSAHPASKLQLFLWQ
jgi:hypothetical protein